VVTFYSPVDRTHLIKRLVALPGDVVELRNEALYVNGTPARYEPLGVAFESIQGHVLQAQRLTESGAGRAHAMQVIPSIAARRDFGPVTVPAGSYFFLGDNRDDSADSRYIGSVPRSLLIGRAHHILVSADILGHWTPRLERIGSAIR
jgi:signal peptidase I